MSSCPPMCGWARPSGHRVLWAVGTGLRPSPPRERQHSRLPGRPVPRTPWPHGAPAWLCRRQRPRAAPAGLAAPRVPRLGARLGGLQAEAAEGREGYEFTSVGNGPRPARLLSGDVLGRFMSQVPWPSGYCPGPAGEWGHRLGSALRGRWSWAAGRAWQIPGRSG